MAKFSKICLFSLIPLNYSQNVIFKIAVTFLYFKFQNLMKYAQRIIGCRWCRIFWAQFNFACFCWSASHCRYSEAAAILSWQTWSPLYTGKVNTLENRKEKKKAGTKHSDIKSLHALLGFCWLFMFSLSIKTTHCVNILACVWKEQLMQ